MDLEQIRKFLLAHSSVKTFEAMSTTSREEAHKLASEGLCYAIAGWVLFQAKDQELTYLWERVEKNFPEDDSPEPKHVAAN